MKWVGAWSMKKAYGGASGGVKSCAIPLFLSVIICFYCFIFTIIFYLFSLSLSLSQKFAWKVWRGLRKVLRWKPFHLS